MDILYVDDDEDDRLIFIDVIKQVGEIATVSTFTSGLEILAHLNSTETTPRLIFIDINMPVMGGYECAAKIREMTRFNHSTIVMFSTTFYTGDIQKMRERNIKFLTKAAHFDEMFQSIKNLISNTGQENL